LNRIGPSEPDAADAVDVGRLETDAADVDCAVDVVGCSRG